MCGISGVVAFTENGKTYFKNVKSSVNTLIQRGPDSNNIKETKNVCFGHSRLSIIDLSQKASQPMTDKSGRYTIVFNGEIYNYKDIREHLIKKGFPIQSNSDTETLLYSYIKDGANCLSKLNGFFAFAIYDNKDNSVFIARDRIGIKPLLYFQDKNKLLFASEMKALIALGIPKVIDTTSLSQYFQFNYIPSPNTIFENVHKLQPGHYILIKDNKVVETQYYKIAYNRSKNTDLTYSDTQIKLRELISESVKSRMISDVPLGSFLSGGIDSSIIVAEASKLTNKLDTFSIGYKDEPFFDETHYAELVAGKFNTNHHTFKLSNDDLYKNLHDFLEYIDEPFADSSALAVFILSKYTHKNIKVSLSGDGADELFSGYNKHNAHYNAIHGNFKSALINIGYPLWKHLPKSRDNRFANTIRQLEKFSAGVKLNEKERYLKWASLMSEESANELLKYQIHLNKLNIRKNEITKNILKTQSISDILYTDMQLVLVNDMLHKVDMMSMANSLEVRTPFLDHNLVDFVFSLPDSYKINSKIRKRILQDAYIDILPNEIYKRPKHGFEVPLSQWFKNEFKNELFNNYLNPDFIQSQGIFNPTEIEKLKEKLVSNNTGDVQANIWAIVVFQHWWKKYMD
jgi:asparagine synthase (glutamine-hydrolysing)